MISYQYKINTYLIIAQLPWGSGEALFKFSRCQLTFIVGKKKVIWEFFRTFLMTLLKGGYFR